MKKIFTFLKRPFVVFLLTAIIVFSSLEAMAFIKGDIDDDGIVNLNEAINALQVVAGHTRSWRILDQIKERGLIKIGVLDWNLAGLFIDQDPLPPIGFEADIARAIAVAIFPDVPVNDVDTKIQFIKTSSSSRFADLQEKKFDILIRVSSFTLIRDRNSDSGPNLQFCPAYFYGGQGLMANAAWTLSNLNGKKIALVEDYEAQYNLEKFMEQQGYSYTKVIYPSAASSEMFSDYEAGTIDAVSSDKFLLLNYKNEFTSPEDHQIFDASLSKDMISPVVLYGDDQWTDIVSWVIYALIEAEELGLDSTNIDAPPNLDNLAVERFLGLEGTLGQELGLTNTWAKEIIKKVGNYGEIYERNIGSVNMHRGPNRLYKDGGVLYSPLMR